MPALAGRGGPAYGTLEQVGSPAAYPVDKKMANMSTVASLVSYRPYKIIDTTVNMFIDVGTQKHATGRFDQFEGISRPQRRRLGQFWLLLKKVTVLIFAIFCPRGLEGERQSGPREGVSRLGGHKTGAQVVLRPRFLGIAVVCCRFYAASSNCELYRSA